MSYEGYIQVLCPNGHTWNINDNGWEPSPDEFKCSHCRQFAIWKNFVDETNGESIGLIQLEKITPIKLHTCTCGNIHTGEPATYRIPDDGLILPKGHEAIRHQESFEVSSEEEKEIIGIAPRSVD